MKMIRIFSGVAAFSVSSMLFASGAYVGLGAGVVSFKDHVIYSNPSFPYTPPIIMGKWARMGKCMQGISLILRHTLI